MEGGDLQRSEEAEATPVESANQRCSDFIYEINSYVYKKLSPWRAKSKSNYYFGGPIL